MLAILAALAMNFSPEYTAVLERTRAVVQFASSVFASSGSALVCSTPTMRRVSDDPDDNALELNALEQDKLTAVQPIATPEGPVFLLDMPHERGLGFAGWLLVGQKMLFWTIRCLRR